RRLPVGVAAQVAVGRAVQADVDLGAEALHGAARGADAVRLVQVVGQLGVRPVGPVQALPGRPVDDPATHLAGQPVGDLGRPALGLAGPQAAGAVGVQPACDAAAVDAQVEGDVLPRPAAVGHQDDLQAVAQEAVACDAEQFVQPQGLG